MRALIVATATGLLAIAHVASAEVRYRALMLQNRAGTFPTAFPRDISENGIVAGLCDTSHLSQLACIWSDAGEITILGDLPGGSQQSEANGINSLGRVVGWGSILHNQTSYSQAFVWSPDGGFSALGSLDSDNPSSGAVAINEWNQVAGNTNSPEGGQAFIWDSQSGMVGIGALPSDQFFSSAWAINNLGQIVGFSYSHQVRSGEAFIWEPEVGMRALGLLPNNSGFANYASDINDLGHATGHAQLADGGGQGFLWDPVEGYTLFGEPLAEFPFSAGFSINDQGVVIGTIASDEETPRYRAMIWDRQNGMRNLNDLLDPCGTPGLGYLEWGVAINNRGQIACVGAEAPGLWRAVRLDPYLPGDLDEDGSVALQDLATMLANFERAGDAEYEHGDLDCDADVDLQDLAILLSNFGETLP
jgi:probable HAF family extracellular repeat protein